MDCLNCVPRGDRGQMLPRGPTISYSFMTFNMFLNIEIIFITGICIFIKEMS